MSIKNKISKLYALKKIFAANDLTTLSINDLSARWMYNKEQIFKVSKLTYNKLQTQNQSLLLQ